MLDFNLSWISYLIGGPVYFNHLLPYPIQLNSKLVEVNRMYIPDIQVPADHLYIGAEINLRGIIFLLMYVFQKFWLFLICLIH